jgi:DNA-directed RNA polymerase subunit RPC12/RpoP
MSPGKELWRKLQMKILKHGNLKPRKFICKDCGCEFIADVTEYTQYACNRTVLWWYIDCPECGGRVNDSVPWEEQENG